MDPKAAWFCPPKWLLQIWQQCDEYVVAFLAWCRWFHQEIVIVSRPVCVILTTGHICLMCNITCLWHYNDTFCHHTSILDGWMWKHVTAVSSYIAILFANDNGKVISKKKLFHNMFLDIIRSHLQIWKLPYVSQRTQNVWISYSVLILYSTDIKVQSFEMLQNGDDCQWSNWS